MISSGLAAIQRPRTRFGNISLSSPGFRYLYRFAFDFIPTALQHLCTRLSEIFHPVSFRIEAAENGKEVVVLVELRARFDEESNIEYSKKPEEMLNHLLRREVKKNNNGDECSRIYKGICI